MEVTMNNTPWWMTRQPTASEMDSLPNHVKAQAREFWEGKNRPCRTDSRVRHITDEPVHEEFHGYPERRIG
jgi:hypothetical protein